MPPRYAYWTILIDSKPTAFRAREQEELLPTLAQLRRTNSDVVMKWFARGRLWDSPEAEREAQQRPPAGREKRTGDWRPGGLHKDPRDRFKKKNRPEHAWSDKDASVRRDRDKLGPPPGDRPLPDGRSRAPRASGGEWRDKPSSPEVPPRGDRPWTGPRKPPTGGAPRGDRPWTNKPPTGAPRGNRPWTNKPPTGAPRGDRPWTSKPPTGAPRSDRPWSNKPPAGAPRGDRPWTNKPPSGPPRGDRPWEDARKPSAGAPRGDRPWTSKPGKPPTAPRGDRPWTNPNRPPSGASRGDRPWTAKPPSGAPRSDRPWDGKPRGKPHGPASDRPWQSKPRSGRPFPPRDQQDPRKRKDDDPDQK